MTRDDEAERMKSGTAGREHAQPENKHV